MKLTRWCLGVAAALAIQSCSSLVELDRLSSGGVGGQGSVASSSSEGAGAGGAGAGGVPAASSASSGIGGGGGVGGSGGDAPGIDCTLSPAQNLSVPALQNIQGLGFALGNLYAFSENFAYRVSTTGTIVGQSPFIPNLVVGLAGAQASVFMGSEIDIMEVDCASLIVVNTFASPCTGGGGGMAFLNGSIWQVGVFPSDPNVVSVGQLNTSGTLIGAFPLPSGVGISPRELDSDGVHLLYVSFDTTCIDTFSLPCMLRLHIFDTDVMEICRQDLVMSNPPNNRLDVNGLASDGVRIYLADRAAARILVFGP